jgi:hypothetical protein
MPIAEIAATIDGDKVDVLATAVEVGAALYEGGGAITTGGELIWLDAGRGGGGVVLAADSCEPDGTAAAEAVAFASARQFGQSFSEGGTSDPHFGQIHVNMAANYCSVILRNCSIRARSAFAKQSSS